MAQAMARRQQPFLPGAAVCAVAAAASGGSRTQRAGTTATAAHASLDDKDRIAAWRGSLRGTRC